MKERPILFNDAMVRAILSGKKTQTRRVVKQNLTPLAEGSHMYSFDHNGINYRTSARTTTTGAFSTLRQFCPFGQPGDRLWVRECFARLGNVGDGRAPEFIYRADSYRDDGFHPRWTPSIHMPREACRLALEIVGVRVERLQEISNEDIRAEGACTRASVTHLVDFQNLWESVYGAESWAVNPWVWVVEFRRVAP